jgi:hypothetical protein
MRTISDGIERRKASRSRAVAKAISRHLAIAALLSFSLPALAHQFIDPKHLRLAIQPERLLLSLTYDVSPGGDARLLRGLFDRDTDGKLSPAEQELLLGYLEEMATLWLSIRSGGKKLTLERLDRRGSGMDLPADATQTLGAALLYAAPLAPWTELEVTVADRDKDAQKRVPIVVDLGPDDSVMFANQGELQPRLGQIHRAWVGQDRPLVLRLRRSRTETSTRSR